MSIDQKYFKAEDFNEDLNLISAYCGYSAACLMAEHFAGCSLYIGGEALRKAKERAIIAGHKAGQSVNKLALAFGFSSQWVLEIIKRMKAEAAKAQGGLF